MPPADESANRHSLQEPVYFFFAAGFGLAAGAFAPVLPLVEAAVFFAGAFFAGAVVLAIISSF